MKSTLDSVQPGTLIVEWLQHGNGKADPAEMNVTEEVRVFRDAITRWAAAYAATRRTAPMAKNVAGKAGADLRAWSRNHFRALDDGDASRCEAPALSVLPVDIAPLVEAAGSTHR